MLDQSTYDVVLSGRLKLMLVGRKRRQRIALLIYLNPDELKAGQATLTPTRRGCQLSSPPSHKALARKIFRRTRLGRQSTCSDPLGADSIIPQSIPRSRNGPKGTVVGFLRVVARSGQSDGGDLGDVDGCPFKLHATSAWAGSLPRSASGKLSRSRGHLPSALPGGEFQVGFQVGGKSCPAKK